MPDYFTLICSKKVVLPLVHSLVCVNTVLVKFTKQQIERRKYKIILSYNLIFLDSDLCCNNSSIIHAHIEVTKLIFWVLPPPFPFSLTWYEQQYFW